MGEALRVGGGEVRGCAGEKMGTVLNKALYVRTVRCGGRGSGEAGGWGRLWQGVYFYKNIELLLLGNYVSFKTPDRF